MRRCSNMFDFGKKYQFDRVLIDNVDERYILYVRYIETKQTQ